MNPDVTNTDAYHTLVDGLLKLIEHGADYDCLRALAKSIRLHKQNKPFNHVKSKDNENQNTQNKTD